MRWNEILAYSFRAMPSGETTTHKVEFLKEKYLMISNNFKIQRVKKDT